MNRNEFIEQYLKIVERALYCSNKTRKEGLLSFEDELDRKKIDSRDIFDYGMCFVLDGFDGEDIDPILSNLIEQEKDEQMHILKKIQKEAVRMIHSGLNPSLIYATLNSFTDIPLNEDKTKEILEKYGAWSA